jgi:hypothetical protein
LLFHYIVPSLSTNLPFLISFKNESQGDNLVTSLTRHFKSDWIQALNVEEFLDHFTRDTMDIDIQEKWVDTQNHFIFMCDEQVSHVSFHFTWSSVLST